MPESHSRPLRHSFPLALGGAAAAALVAFPSTASPAWRAAAALSAVIAGVSAALWRRAVADRGGPSEAAATSPPLGAAPRPTGKRTTVSSDGAVDTAAFALPEVAELLRDIRDSLGGSEVVLWRVAADGAEPRPAAWATCAPGPQIEMVPTLLALVAWSAAQRLVQCPADEMSASVAAAPVEHGGTVLGALTVHAAGGFDCPVDQVRYWSERHARRLGDLLALAAARVELEREGEHSQFLLRTAQNFQLLRSVGELGAALCTAALGVCGADRAVLVRWDRGREVGSVVGAAGSDAPAIGQPVAATSHVATACREALPQLWEDARHLDGGTAVFGPGEPTRRTGTLGVVPLVGPAGVVGAVAIECETPGRVGSHELRGVRLLAALAAVSLQMLGDFEAAERDANTDALTGLPNRRAFDAQFGPALDRADRFGEPAALLVCDVDHFKLVNDSHGHDAGDHVLQSLAVTLQRGVRAVDLCARLGGEEFALLLPRTNRRGAVEMAERLRRTIESRPVLYHGRELWVTASFGIAVYPATVTSRDELFAAADRALYTAKRDGRNCVRSADATAVFDGS